jgi:hypothetical protein
MKNLFCFKSQAYFVLCAFLFTYNIHVSGQTNPEPFNLSSGNYSFTSWDSASPAGSFPSNMIFHFVSSNQVAAFYNDGTSDYDCRYNNTKRPRINGLLEDGISIVTTSSSQYNNCDSGAAASRFMGAVLLALNASGRGNISVTWTGETLIPGDGTPNPRIWNLRLQYRVGNSGLFTDVPGPVEYVAAVAAGSPITLGPTLLPVNCWNQPLVQVRWIYFESSAGDGGTRSKLRLDDIEITSDIFQGINDPQVNSAGSFEIYPNPANGHFTVKTDPSVQGTIKVIDILGQELIQTAINTPLNTINCAELPCGVYFVRVTDTDKVMTRTRKLIVR